MDFNKDLHRSINTGSQYDRYFEKVSCKATYKGKGNTTDALYLMKDTTLKYAYQTKKIAPTLKGNTTQETVNNIYKFLYNNIQYSIDGYDQQLRSPACSWQERSNGIDCKSYAIFGMSILLNLGYDNCYFRKVKQKNYEPDQWSHVYVVVKQNGNEYVIDPTIHTNRQVEYTKKKDIKVSKLPYYQLNAGASSNPTNTRDHEILSGFQKVKQYLKTLGVANITIDQIDNAVKKAYYKYGSFNFPFKLVNNQLLIDRTKYNLTPNTLNSGFDFSSLLDNSGSGITTSISNDYSDMFSSGSGISDMFSSGGGEFLDMFSSAGSSEGSQVTGMLDMATGSIPFLSEGLNLLDGLLGDFDIKANISNVFTYGLNSWNASTDPTRMAETIQQYYMPRVKERLEAVNGSRTASELATNLTELDRCIVYFRELPLASMRRRSWASSTEAGFQFLSDTFKQFYNETMPQVLNQYRSAGFSIAETQTQTVFGDVDHIYRLNIQESNTTDEKNGSYTHKAYRITKIPTQSNIVNDVQAGSGGSNDGSTSSGGLFTVATLGTLFMLFK